MIRFIFVASTVILFLILFSPVLVAEWIIGKWNKEKKDYSSLRIQTDIENDRSESDRDR